MSLDDVLELAKEIGVNIEEFEIQNQEYVELKSISKWGFESKIIDLSNLRQLSEIYEELQELRLTKQESMKQLPKASKDEVKDLMYLYE